MGDSDTHLLVLVLVGIGYAVLKLGDEAVLVVDELGYALAGVDNLLGQLQAQGVTFDLTALALALFLLYLAAVAVKKVLTEM